MYRFILTILMLTLVTPVINAKNLSDRLKQLARTANFQIRGLNRLGTASAVETAGVPLQQVRTLLEKFDYVIVHGPKQKIQSLIIVGPKQPLSPAPPVAPLNSPIDTPITPSLPPLVAGQEGEITIITQRDGPHHLVNATLIGNAGQRLTQELLIDTGASVTVIPATQASALGFTLTQLPTRTMQTLKGSLQVRIATLPFLELGNVRVPNLNVAFAENDGLGKRGLLGMNLLSRYLFILDDERNELTLINNPH